MTPSQNNSAVFLHSMWRTGSTYLLSRFTAEEKYLTFYEPFNGELSSARKRRMAAQEYDQRHKALRHPGSSEGYFALFNEADPLTGKPLWSYSSPSLCLYDVYNGLSRSGTELLEACCRLAHQRNRIPVFGFCHSGVQIPDMFNRFSGHHVYLSRPCRDQFVSYQPERNDFFVPATTMQLMASSRWGTKAAELVPAITKWMVLYPAFLIRSAPHAATMKMARRIAAGLSLAEKYKLFYLSWLVSHQPVAEVNAGWVSLPKFQDDAHARSDFEQRFGVELQELNYPRVDQTLFGQFDVVRAEAEVEAVFRSA
ncbi:MAG: hypothetical protein LW854_21045 [Rubrivivax sp.]|nr:hypothetical protein [Rubrivivax sp.]